MVISPIRTVDLDDSAFNGVPFEIVIYRNESPLVSVGARRHIPVLRSESYYCSRTLGRSNERQYQARKRFRYRFIE
jgi:hypothetical protein